MKKIKVCGVPEHFNLPWTLGIEEKKFEQQAIDVQWISVPEGTGKMCQMLQDESTDVAIVLTEGIFKSIAAGNASKIVQIYVQSPLIWGVHVAAESKYQSIESLENKKAAISRLGSGSQLMTLVHAKKHNWTIENIEYEIVNTLDGAVKSLSNQTADYFMWEQFMTKPLVDAGIFRKINSCPTPWPCFMIAVRAAFLENNLNLVQQFLKIINQQTIDFKNISNIETMIASQFNLKKDDVKKWLSMTKWSQKNLSEEQFNAIQFALIDLKIIDKKINYATTIHQF